MNVIIYVRLNTKNPNTSEPNKRLVGFKRKYFGTGISTKKFLFGIVFLYSPFYLLTGYKISGCYYIKF